MTQSLHLSQGNIVSFNNELEVFSYSIVNDTKIIWW